MKKLLCALLAAGSVSIALAGPVDDLVTATRRDSDVTVQNLLGQGVDVNAVDSEGHTALTIAIHEKSMKVLPVLLGWRGTRLNAANRAGETPLMMAIITDQTDLARELILKGAATNKPGWSPLHYAATRSNLDIMQMLLARDAYIDAMSPNETTPLMMAARYGGSEGVQFLLDKGADPWTRNRLGLTALDFARMGGNAESIDLITRAQARRPDPGTHVRPLAPLTPAQEAVLKGEQIPLDSAPVPLIYPEGQEPPPPQQQPALPVAPAVTPAAS
ncbi:MAG: ankyrin repeat domain-containing protein [Brachymonas sp.]